MKMFLQTAEVARLLGVSTTTIRNLVNAKSLAARRYDGRLKFSPEYVEEYARQLLGEHEERAAHLRESLVKIDELKQW